MKGEANGASRINLSLMLKDHAPTNAREIRREIAKKESEIQLLRLELENLIKHASIEGVSLDEPILTLEPNKEAEQ